MSSSGELTPGIYVGAATQPEAPADQDVSSLLTEQLSMLVQEGNPIALEAAARSIAQSTDTPPDAQELALELLEQLGISRNTLRHPRSKNFGEL